MQKLSKEDMKACKASMKKEPIVPVRRSQSLYYVEHRDSILARVNDYNAKHREEKRKVAKEYREANKAAIKLRRQRKARLKQLAKQMERDENERDIQRVNQQIIGRNEQ